MGVRVRKGKCQSDEIGPGGWGPQFCAALRMAYIV